MGKIFYCVVEVLCFCIEPESPLEDLGGEIDLIEGDPDRQDGDASDIRLGPDVLNDPKVEISVRVLEVPVQGHVKLLPSHHIEPPLLDLPLEVSLDLDNHILVMDRVIDDEVRVAKVEASLDGILVIGLRVEGIEGALAPLGEVDDNGLFYPKL